MRQRWFEVRGRGLWLLCAAMVLCGAEGRALSQRSRAEGAARGSHATPSGLRAAYLAAVQAEAGADYAVKESAAGLAAKNPAQGLAVGFSADGVALEASAARATLHPSRFGCEGALREVERARPEARAGRVEYQREGFTEWYVNGPLGVEQGFTVAEAPACASAEGASAEGRDLVVELALGEGLTAALGKGGEEVELRDAGGERVLGYSELYAMDATGKALPARLGVTPEGVSIRVEAEGAAYPVVIDPLIWKDQQKLLASDGGANDSFGAAVALSGDTAIIGATWNDEKADGAGAAYIFVRSGAGWIQQQKLVASDGLATDNFGTSIALAGDTAIVGSPGGSESTGAAYVFARSGSTWTEQQKLVPGDAVTYDNIGISVALSGDTAMIGSWGSTAKGERAGAAYVFTRSGGTWSEQQKLLASDGADSDIFGTAIALSGDTALIGAPYNDEKGNHAGAAYVFARSGGSWTEQQKLLASDGVTDDGFGYAITLSGDTAIIGAPWTNGSATFPGPPGAAYAFVRSGGTWTEQQKLEPSDGGAGDYFGRSVALSGDTALIGAGRNSPIDKDGFPASGSGAAYVFVRSGATWTAQRKLSDAEAQWSEWFGVSVALSGDTALIGASSRHEKENSVGAAYVVGFGGSTGDACTSNTDCASRLCWAGACVEPAASCAAAADDTPCEDGNPCTQQDRCKGGACLGQTFTLCPAAPADEVCSQAVCLPASAACDVAWKADGSACPGGVCIAGKCSPQPTSSSSGAGGEGGASASATVSASSSGAGGEGGASANATVSASSASSGAGGASGGGNEPGESGGCGCATRPSSNSGALGMLLGLLLVARRRQRPASPRA